MIKIWIGVLVGCIIVTDIDVGILKMMLVILLLLLLPL